MVKRKKLAFVFMIMFMIVIFVATIAKYSVEMIAKIIFKGGS